VVRTHCPAVLERLTQQHPQVRTGRDPAAAPTVAAAGSAFRDDSVGMIGRVGCPNGSVTGLTGPRIQG
jgi:hypothetical protein